MKVVTQVTVSGGMPTRKSTVTTYYRGSLVRTENDGRIQILDSKSGSLTILDPVKKTYRTAQVGQLVGASSPARSMSIKASVNPTSLKKSILGHSAQRYTGTASITNGRGTMKMTLEQWAASSLRTPQGLNTGLAGLPGGASGLGGAAALKKELAKIKGLPLESKVTMQMEGAGPAIVSESKVIRFQTLSLDPALFRVPAGYKKLDSKRPPLEPRKFDHSDH